MEIKELDQVIVNLKDSNIQQVYIEITDKCNLFCDYCFNNSAAEKKRIISPETVYSIVDNCSKENKRPYVYLSGGEPLLHPELKTIVNTLINKMNCKVKVLTNGSLISRMDFSDMDKRVNWQIGSAQIATINLYETNKEAYSNGIHILKNIFPDSNITLAYTITRNNIKNISSIIDEFANINNINILLSFVQSRGRGVDTWDENSVSLSEKLKVIQKFSGKWDNVMFCGLELDKDLEAIGKYTISKDCNSVKEYYVDNQQKVHFCNKIDEFCNCKNLTLDIQNNYSFDISDICGEECPKYKHCLMSCMDKIKTGEKICKMK